MFDPVWAVHGEHFEDDAAWRRSARRKPTANGLKQIRRTARRSWAWRPKISSTARFRLADTLDNRRKACAQGRVLKGRQIVGAVRDEGLSVGATARRLNLAENEVRRMLNPAHATKIDRLEMALASFGRHLEVSVLAGSVRRMGVA